MEAILAQFKRNKVRFALEVHPTEIALNLVTAERALAAIGGDRSFGFNFDPSHLYWQGVDPVKFLLRFRDRHRPRAHERPSCRWTARAESWPATWIRRLAARVEFP